MADFDPQPDTQGGIVNNAGLAYLVANQAQLPLAMFIVNQQTGLQYTTEIVAGVMTVVQTGPGSVTIPPSSPEYFVASTGSDAITQSGTLAAPLASVQESLRRHGATGWLVDCFTTVVDTVNAGADPTFSFPVATGRARPPTIRTTYAVDVSFTATGGTAGNVVTATPGTLTSALVAAANAHRGKIAKITSGPAAISGTRDIIDSNDGVGGVTIAGLFATPPTAGTTVDIESRTGKITWTGQLSLIAPGDFYNDGIDFVPTGANATVMLFEGQMLEYGTRWTSPAAGGFRMFSENGDWQSGACKDSPFSLAPTSRSNLPLPTGVTPCGCRIDGSASVISIASSSVGSPGSRSNWLFSRASINGCDIAATFGGMGAARIFIDGTSQLTDCGTLATNALSSVTFLSVRITSGRRVTYSSGFNTAICAWDSYAAGQVAFLNFITPAAADDLCQVSSQGQASFSTVAGVAGAPGKLFLKVTIGGVATAGGASTATGGTVGQDVAVDGGTAFPVADFNAMVVVGAQNGTFQHSTSNLGASPITIDKFSGDSAVAVAATVLVINNAFADVGDHCHLTPTSINATVTKWSAVCTLNTITITTDAAPTVAPWTFNWELVKATV